MNSHHPFFIYPGAKTKHIPHIIEHFKHRERLVDVFTGSGAVFLGTDFSTYLCADVNAVLIDTYNQLKTNLESFVRHTRPLCEPRNNTKTRYYELRDEFNQCDDAERRTHLYYVIASLSFNGLVRFNKSGAFNVPYGDRRAIVFKEEQIRFFSKKAIRTDAQFVLSDFVDTFDLVLPSDSVYLDPPFSARSRTSNFTTYSGVSFSAHHHERLCSLAEQAVKNGSEVVLSDNATTETLNRYRHHMVNQINVRRNISANKVSRGDVSEIIVSFQSISSRHQVKKQNVTTTQQISVVK